MRFACPSCLLIRKGRSRQVWTALQNAFSGKATTRRRRNTNKGESNWVGTVRLASYPLLAVTGANHYNDGL